MSSPAPTRTSGRDRLKTLVATLVFVAALSVLVVAFALARSGDPRPSAGPIQGDGVGSGGYHVGGPGCDDGRAPEVARNARTPWCSLARAARAAPDDSVVFVAGGTYPALELDGRSTPTVHAVSFQPADRGARPQIAGVSLTAVQGISVRGFLFTGPASVRSAERITIADNGFAGHGLYVRQSRRVTIADNRVRHVKGEERAFLAQGAPETANKPNEFLTIRGNVFDDIDHDAIAVYNSHRHVVIANNRISNVHQPQGFRFHSDAMQLMGGDDVTLSGNVVHDVSHGILFKDGVPSTRLKIIGNLVTRTKGAGLQIYDAPGARLERNTIWGTRFGLIIGDTRTRPGQTKATLVRNVIDQLLQQSPRAVSSARSNLFGRGARVGRPAYRGRPNFVDARAGDLRIKRSRPGAGLSSRRPLPGAQLRVR